MKNHDVLLDYMGPHNGNPMGITLQSYKTYQSVYHEKSYQILFKNRSRKGSVYSHCFRDIAVKKSYISGIYVSFFSLFSG